MKNHLRFSIALLLSLIFNISYAQGPVFSWDASWGNDALEHDPYIITDEEGNIYCAGFFIGTVDFDPGPGVMTLTSNTSGFGKDTYISKLDSTGALLWVRQIGGASNAKSILYDPAGYIYVGGTFAFVADFNPGPGVFNMTPVNNSDDVYVVKFDLQGLFVFAFQVGGNGQEQLGDLAMAADGNLILGGLFSGTSDFDPGPGEAIFTAGFWNDLFVVKHNTDGSFIWAREISGNIQGGINEVVTDDDGNIYIAGIFDDFRDFDPGPDSLILAAHGQWDAFVVKLNSMGELVWVRQLGHESGDTFADDMVIDENNNLTVTGPFSGTIDFDPGPNALMLTAQFTDSYVWKLTEDGEMIWAVQFEGTSFDRAFAMCQDAWGDIYITGYFGEMADFDPGPDTYELTSTGSNDKDDAFVAKLDSNGHFKWAYAMGGLLDDSGLQVHVDRFGNVFTAGRFEGTAGFYPGDQAQDSLVSNGSWDVFLTRWRQCPETTGEVSVNSCAAYNSPSGNHTWTQSGDYLDTLTNVFGCDSILTIHLMITEINTGVSLVNTTLTADQAGSSYQWLDCDDGYVAIPGESNQSYTPATTGNYAVSIIEGECSDTSDCFHVMTVGIEEEKERAGIRIYPNPAGDLWFVDLGRVYQHIELEIIDQCGRRVYVSPYHDKKLISVDISIPAGIYFIHVITGDHNSFLRLMRN